jgi:hypothetical protein
MLEVRVQQRYSAVATRFIIPQSLDERRYLWQKLTLRRVAHFVSLYVKKSDFTKALEKAKKELTEFGTKIMGIGAGISAMGGAITGSLTGALLHFAKTGDELDKMSLRTGVSATALAELGFAAEQSGANMDTVESALKRMARNLGDIGPEGAKTRAALDAIGLSSENLQKLSPEDQFQAIAERIGDIQDPTKKAAAAMAVFGEGGRQLLPMMESIRELREEARDLGIAPSPESVAAAAQITDAINRVRRVIGAVIYEIGAAIAPMAADVLAGFLSVVSSIRKFVVANKSLIITAAKVGAVLVAVGTAIMGIGAAFIGAGMVISGVLSAMAAFAAVGSMVASVMGAIGAVMATVLSPIGLLVAALAGGVYVWARFTESGRTAVATLVSSVTGLFGNLRATVTDTMGGIVEAVRAGDLALAGQIAMVGLRLVFQQGLEGINSLFGETMGSIVGQVLSGDLAGAFATVGSVILDTWAQVTSGMVGMMTAAARGIADKWAETVNKISNQILKMASEGGVVGKVFEKFSGVNMQEETARAARLNAQMRAAGMNTNDENDTASQIAAGTYKDPSVEAIRQRIHDITKQIDEGREAVTAATGQAVEDATGGQAEATSNNIRELQKQLAELRREASEKLAAGKDGSVDSKGQKSTTSGDSEPQEIIKGKTSVVTNNLLTLQSMVSPSQEKDKQTRIAEVQVKKLEQQLEKSDLMILAIEKLGLHHG